MTDLSKKINEGIAEFIRTIPVDPKGLYKPVSYFLSLGGKRLRPQLVLMGNDLFGGDAADALPAAIAIELFHNFTLIHDDIMDNAPLRRNRATVHSKWDLNTALLSGDVMLVHAYKQLQKTKKERLPQALHLFNLAAERVCEGQQLDMDFEKKKTVKMEQYIHMIGLKTAELVGASLSLGATIAGAGEKDTELMHVLGVHLGIAFQLQDDLLDVYGDKKKFGKQKGGDIIANKKTFLFIKALELARGKEKQELRSLFSKPAKNASKKVKRVTELYDRFGIREHAKKEMEKHIALSLSCLDQLSASPQKKQVLAHFGQNLLKREH